MLHLLCFYAWLWLCVCVLTGSNEDWEEFVGEWSRRWSHAALRLAHYQETRPLLRVYYEDIKSNATREVLRMLDFLRVPHSKSLVEAKLGGGYGSFRRGAGRSFIHFTEQQRLVVVTMLSHVVRECSEKGYHDTEQYVRNYLSCLWKITAIQHRIVWHLQHIWLFTGCWWYHSDPCPAVYVSELVTVKTG